MWLLKLGTTGAPLRYNFCFWCLCVQVERLLLPSPACLGVCAVSNIVSARPSRVCEAVLGVLGGEGGVPLIHPCERVCTLVLFFLGREGEVRPARAVSPAGAIDGDFSVLSPRAAAALASAPKEVLE